MRAPLYLEIFASCPAYPHYYFKRFHDFYGYSEDKYGKEKTLRIVSEIITGVVFRVRRGRGRPYRNHVVRGHESPFSYSM